SVCREQVGDILQRAGYCSYVRILRDALKSEGPATIQLYLFYVHAVCLIYVPDCAEEKPQISYGFGVHPAIHPDRRQVP
ncbi:MAG TPA: hypothetical protein VF780_03725, partial [Nitrosospira sp.]